MDVLFRIEMLGRFEVRQGSRKITRFRTQKTASLLACLVLFRSRSHPREGLMEMLWPDSERKAARTNLRVALNALRNQLEPPGVPPGTVLQIDTIQVRLNPLAYTCDVEDFEIALQEAERQEEGRKQAALWHQAINLYGGELLPGFYEEWIVSERERLREAYLAALRPLVKELAEKRQYEQAIEYAHRMVQADPLREETTRNLMRLYLMAGRPQDALSQYQTLERRLQSDLQMPPSQATRHLAQHLAQGQSTPPSSHRDALTTRAPKDENSRTILPAPRLPMQFTRFFGREEEIARLIPLLTNDDERRTTNDSGSHSTPASEGPVARLMTLTGPGGTGKTRLSLEIAARVKEVFPGGIWFVALAELEDPQRLGEALRNALELPYQTRSPVLEQVTAFLQDQDGASLLILDNFEQITAGGAPIVWTLLNRVPALRCLVTSRQPLALPGEREIPVPPLPTPTEGETKAADAALSILRWEPRILLTYPSVALFVDRAQSVRPEFQITPRNAQAIAATCEKLEGIPLAIELAAARANTLTPSQILDRLSERFELLASRRADKGERHRSLWAAIDWSYHLLPPDLQRFFARLSVFRGGWTLEAAEAVCAEPAALDYLAQLRSHSLLFAEERAGAMRFRMLETLREFAAEQLKPEEREEAERRHAAYFHAWVTGAKFSARERAVWFARYEQDLDNLRAALSWSLQEGHEIEFGLQIAGRLNIFWYMRGYLSEGRRWYASLLERASETPTAGLAHSLYGAGSLAYHQGDFTAAQAMLERCLPVAQAAGDAARVRGAYEVSGSIAYVQGDYDQARIQYEKALAMARAQGEATSVASALGNLANVAQSTGDYAASRTLNEECLQIWREQGDRFGEARTLHNLAVLAYSHEQYEEARAYYEQSLQIKQTLEDRYGLGFTLAGIAGVAIKQRDYRAAAAYARESLALGREINARVIIVEVAHMQAALLQALGEYEVAAQMWSALEQIRGEMQYPISAGGQSEYDRTQRALAEALGTEVYEAMRAKGITLSLEQILIGMEETLARHAL